MRELIPAGPLDVTGFLAGERAALVDLLTRLTPDEWAAPTECPAWSVKGIALHLLGDDLSLLARQRDAATNGLRFYAQEHPGLTFSELLSGFNEQWVRASQYLSESLVVELLTLSGAWTLDFYSRVDLSTLGEVVRYFGATNASPYWQIVAREFMERWEHQHQIRRAVGASDLGAPYLAVAAQVAIRHFVAHLPGLDASPGTSIVVEIPPTGAWTMLKQPDSWILLENATDSPDVTLVLDPSLATVTLSRGLPLASTASAFTASGTSALAEHATAALAQMTNRYNRTLPREST